MVRYKNYTIEYRAKPIPSRRYDWDFVHDDYDGAIDSNDRRCGSGASVEDCIKQIEEIIEEEPIMSSYVRKYSDT